MKKAFVIVLSAALLFAALCFAGCGKKNPGTDAPTPPVTEEGEALTDAAAFQSLLDEMRSLPQKYETDFVRGVTTGDALVSVLQKGRDENIRFKSDASDPVTIPAGNYADKDVIFAAANAGLVSDASLGVLTVDAAGAEGVTLNGHVGTLAVYGEDIAVTLSGGADTVYVQGKNCTVTLTGGTYGMIVSVNQTVVFKNETEADVTVYMANGAPQVLKAGETLSFN